MARIRDESPLNDNEIRIDYLPELQSSLRELKKSDLNTSTPNLFLGLLGEFAFSRWLISRGIEHDHRSVTHPGELLEDFRIFRPDSAEEIIKVDVKTSGIRPPKVSRILSIEQFESIPRHSDILVWTYNSDWRNSITIDSWTKVATLNETKLKAVSAPPDISISNDPAVDMDFTETKYVYEVPSFLMLNIEDLELEINGFGLSNHA